MYPARSGIGAPSVGWGWRQPRWHCGQVLSSIREQRYLEPGVAPEQDGALDGVGAVAVADIVERGVERTRVAELERQDELDRARVGEVGERDPEQREAALLDQRSCAGHQLPERGQQRHRA